MRETSPLLLSFFGRTGEFMLRNSLEIASLIAGISSFAAGSTALISLFAGL